MKMWPLAVPLLLVAMSGCPWGVSAQQPKVDSVPGTTVFGTSVQVGRLKVSQFLGLRFGSRPVRFQPTSVAALANLGEVNATSFPKSCPGLLPILPMDEDCLFLNIYVPPDDSGRPNKAKPVMVWLYGGAFVLGSGSQYDGSLLAGMGGVIVVTLNYRVGPLGFLYTGDENAPGNVGLLDQMVALKWINENIGHFGGDVNRITLFGESAGAVSVSYHMTSPLSQGLFHRAILQSGSRFNPWALDVNAKSRARRLGRMLSCKTEPGQALVRCLRGKAWQAVLSAAGPRPMLLESWAPVVDGHFVLPFNQSSPVLFEGPVMIGTNNREGGLLLTVLRLAGAGSSRRESHQTYVRSSLQRLFPAQWREASPADRSLAARVVDCVYRGPGSNHTHVSDQELEQFVGDVDIHLGSQQFLNALLARKAGAGDVYQYYFDHYPDNVEGGEKGMDHAMDLDYTFGFHRGLRATRLSPFRSTTVSQSDQNLAVRFRAYLTNFADSGNPNRPKPNIQGWPYWEPYTTGDQSTYLSISSRPRIASRLKADRMTLWQDTMPGLLEGRGPEHWDLTPWAPCWNVTSSLGSKTPALPSATASVLFVFLYIVLHHPLWWCWCM